MSHDAEAYARLHEIVSGARELSGLERVAYLDAACAHDTDLRDQVEALLAAGADDQVSQDLFAESRVRAARGDLEGALDARGRDWLPERIGEYTIVRQIGRGGMGVVYEAEQTSPQRRVALKLLHPMQETPERLRRFRQEVSLLGRLQHPGIAQIHAASTYDVGRGPQPFFTMELVEGVDIRTSCERRRLPRRDRIELLARVADAVQHAHDHEIVHRDLKPDNVMVDEFGNPRILDFGIAHARTHSTEFTSVVTEQGQLVGTLAYMAPEQLRESGGTVSPRVDVFALGVLGFELLLGRLPREIEDLPLAQMIAALSSSEPLRARALDTSLRGDVDTILGKALETDPARRYESAAALAGDLRRHLADEPIRAHPPSSVYLVSKFVRRHRALVAGTVATVVVALAGAGFALNYALQANERADEIEEQSIVLQQRADEIERQSVVLLHRTHDVMRLSLAQDYEDLIDGVRDLWPAHPERIPALQAWLDDARALVDELPALRAKREELGTHALPRSAEQRRVEREGHPEFATLAPLELERLVLGRAHEQRAEGVEVEPTEVNWDAAPADAATLSALADQLVGFERTTFGEEPLGLALARRGFELARGDQRWTSAAVLARACFVLGRDDEALAAHPGDDAGAPPDSWLGERAALEDAIARARSADGLAAASAELAELDTRIAELDARLDTRRTWEFPDVIPEEPRARWWHTQLGVLITELESLSEPAKGLLSPEGVSEEHGWGVARRLAFAQELEARFAPGGDFARRWDEALPLIAERHPELAAAAQVGLVPLGPDPESGLLEFWHPQSGAEPTRGDDGRLRMELDSGMVFVLVPGGTFWMGAQPLDPDGRNYDPEATRRERPVHEVELSTFLISKYEYTQEQWERAYGVNPGRWQPGVLDNWLPGPHPAEQVNWFECVEMARTHGLTLPSEAQWEYACRAGTDTPVPFAREEYRTHANIADQSHMSRFAGVTFSEPWDDGMHSHGGVGRLEPNAFGLHDVIGNVWEWCLDGYDSSFYERSPRRDPVGSMDAMQQRIYRGGGAINAAETARSAIRFDDKPHLDDLILGVRPARAWVARES